MMKLVALAALAVVAVPGAAVAAGAPSEVHLAATSLESGHFKRAARQLQAVTPGMVNDAARLINLGNAYAGLGRVADARAAYQAARVAPETDLLLADGSEASSRAIAKRAMERLAPAYAMR